VAVTRPRKLLMLAVPHNTSADILSKLQERFDLNDKM
jgi:hypothetical protein